MNSNIFMETKSYKDFGGLLQYPSNDFWSLLATVTGCTGDKLRSTILERFLKINSLNRVSLLHNECLAKCDKKSLFMNRPSKFCSAFKIRLLLEMFAKYLSECSFARARKTLQQFVCSVFSGDSFILLVKTFVDAQKNAVLACSQRPFDTPI